MLLVTRCRALWTSPKVPSPSFCSISYSPILLHPLNRRCKLRDGVPAAEAAIAAAVVACSMETDRRSRHGWTLALGHGPSLSQGEPADAWCPEHGRDILEPGDRGGRRCHGSKRCRACYCGGAIIATSCIVASVRAKNAMDGYCTMA